MKNILFLLFLSIGMNVNGQVAINTDGSLPDNSAMLDVKSMERGLLIPRMNGSKRDNIENPATGLLIFCTDDSLYYSNKGSPFAPNWEIVDSKWLNSGSDISFIGGNAGIGTVTPIAKLDIQGTLRVADGTEGARKVLTSDGNGIATWTGGNTHFIGESYGGGMVFYVYDNGHHGLISAMSDQSTGIRWHGGTPTNTMAMADGMNAGKTNTTIIIANQAYGDGSSYAARICNEYSVTVEGVTYGDWYLPSLYELNLLYLQKVIVGGFADFYYWSSTEYLMNYAWFKQFWDGGQDAGDKGGALNVRAIRTF